MINYHKRKNSSLFNSLESENTLFLSKIQNYIPIYNRFFNLNETNYNNINLNHKCYLYNVEERKEKDNNFFTCTIKNINNEKTKKKELFFKEAPLLDPFKYLVGKYDVQNKNLFQLPDLTSNEKDVHNKLLDMNNSAYIDGLFLYLTNQLSEKYYFIHSVDYYGSFLAIKNNYNFNVFDDIEYLNGSDFFEKNKNILFTIDDYEHLFQENSLKKPPLNIDKSSIKSIESINSITDDFFENIFDSNSNKNDNSEIKNMVDLTNDNCITLNNLKEYSMELEDITNDNNIFKSTDNKTTTLKSESSCSSRTSYTSCGNNEEETNDCNNCCTKEKDCEEMSDNSEKSEWTDDTVNDSDEDDFEEEKIMVTIPKFPIQLICMENCEMTLDELIMKNELDEGEWFSALMQVIMILITYQKVFGLTHNDLHTNNVMFNTTNKKYIYYFYQNKYYQVPTFGRIFKIIDFGRSIYKYEGKLFCSDSFQQGGDAATQYNTEPYLNEKKPRLEPNYSFDLCRLACSIFDYLIEDMNEIQECNDPVTKLIVEWCLDDKGINLLYKNNGADRYPDFKLYKMIARCVHKHTPQSQLERNEFKSYLILQNLVPSTEKIINIDEMPILM